jgi:transposase-like protein
MPRGKQTPPEIREKCLSIVASTGNVSEASKQTGIPETTIRDWIKQNDEFVEYRNNKKQEFIDKSWEIINKAQKLIDSRVVRAIEYDELLNKQIELIKQDKKLTEQDKINAIEFILQKKAENTKDMAVILGTLYDKQALANKEATAIVEGNIGIKKFEEL